MVETHDHFVDRLEALGRKHEKMTHGYYVKLDKNGLLVATPRRPSRRGLGLMKLLVLVAVGLVAFKTFTLAAYGPVTYNDRLSHLENGTLIEQAGAKVLTIDPVTAALADSVGPILR